MSDNFFYTDIRKYGNKIYHRGYEGGTRFSEEFDFSPSLFISSKDDGSEWKTLVGSRPMQKMDFETIKDAENFCKKYEDVGGIEVHGNRKYGIQFSHSAYPNSIPYDLKLIKIGSTDIEVHSDHIRGFPHPHIAQHEVVTIANTTNNNKVWCGSVIPQGFDAFQIDTVIDEYEVEYYGFYNEKDLLLSYLNYLEREDFDILTGWNSNGFDFPYLYKRIEKVLSTKHAKRLSPLGIAYTREYEEFNKINTQVKLFGVQLLDYLDLYKKFGKTLDKLEDLKLNTVCAAILNEEKLDYSEYGNLLNLYKQNPKLHTEYCIRDSILVKRLQDKLKFINIAISIAYKAHVNYEDALGVTEVWDSYIYGELLKRKICVPPSHIQNSEGFEGAYCKPVQTGFFEWVMSGDFGSLYPNTIAQFNISPETIGEYISGVDVDRLLRKDYPTIPEGYCLGALGWTFKTDKIGIIPELVIRGLGDRSSIKNRMIELKKALNASNNHDEKKRLEDEIIKLDAAQAAEKEFLNALYGALGAGAFRYFDPRLAETVTLCGQLSIKSVESNINKYLQKIFGDNRDRIIALDTDSNYIVLNQVLTLLGADHESDLKKVEILDAFYKKNLSPVIETTLNDIVKALQCKKNYIVMKREGIASKHIHLAKKIYVQWVLNSEGVQYAEPKLKIMGFVAIKSSTPPKVKKMFKESFKTLMTLGVPATQELIKGYYDDFKTFTPYDIAKPSSISDVEKYHHPVTVFKKGAGRHIKGALFYNKYIKDMGLDSKYNLIYSGDKIKMLNLKLPNKLHTDVICYVDAVPEEFEIQKSIDYKNMWELLFFEPMKTVFEICDWQIEKKETLFD